MARTFEIKNMRQAFNCGTLKATFTVAFAALELNDCKLVEGRDGLFFAPPSRKYEKDGQAKFANYFYITSEALKNEIEAEALSTYKPMSRSASQPQSRSESTGGGGYAEPEFDSDIPFAHRYDWLERTAR